MISIIHSFLDTTVRELTAAESQMLSGLLKLDTQKVPVDVLAKHIKYVDQMPMFVPEPDMPSVMRVFWERLVWAQVEHRVTRSTALWIGYLCQDHHHRAVLWAWTVKRWCLIEDDGDPPLTLSALYSQVPGAPADTENLWASQRLQGTPNGNILDQSENWL